MITPAATGSKPHGPTNRYDRDLLASSRAKTVDLLAGEGTPFKHRLGYCFKPFPDLWLAEDLKALFPVMFAYSSDSAAREYAPPQPGKVLHQGMELTSVVGDPMPVPVSELDLYGHLTCNT